MRRRRIVGSRSALSRFFIRHDITFKKKPAGRGAGSARRRPRAKLRWSSGKAAWIDTHHWPFGVRLPEMRETKAPKAR
jgi:hypothetical protein